jgi:hypothetical protein
MEKNNLESARKQLDLILGFFPRVDTKLSVVLGIDLGMLGILLTKAPDDVDKITTADWIGALLFAAAMIVSLIRLYLGSFPNVNGGENSLVFFGAIAQKKDGDGYAREFNALAEESLTDDLLRQVWRNAVILKEKYSHLKSAYIAMVIGIVPWSFSLYEFIRVSALVRH